MVKGLKRKRIREHNERMSFAWHTAVLTRVKDIPEMSTLIVDDTTTPQVKKEQTPDQMMAAGKMLAVAFGGTIVEVYD